MERMSEVIHVRLYTRGYTREGGMGGISDYKRASASVSQARVSQARTDLSHPDLCNVFSHSASLPMLATGARPRSNIARLDLIVWMLPMSHISIDAFE